jgi:hypothetical protein
MPVPLRSPSTVPQAVPMGRHMRPHLPRINTGNTMGYNNSHSTVTLTHEGPQFGVLADNPTHQTHNEEMLSDCGSPFLTHRTLDQFPDPPNTLPVIHFRNHGLVYPGFVDYGGTNNGKWASQHHRNVSTPAFIDRKPHASYNARTTQVAAPHAFNTRSGANPQWPYIKTNNRNMSPQNLSAPAGPLQSQENILQNFQRYPRPATGAPQTHRRAVIYDQNPRVLQLQNTSMYNPAVREALRAPVRPPRSQARHQPVHLDAAARPKRREEVNQFREYFCSTKGFILHY